KPGVSIQMAARELRYAWFRERMNALGVPVLATAHHRDDAIETLLLNMLRGAGRQGFMGLPPTRNGIVRPLIEVSRQDIEAFAREQGIAFRDDPSNRDPAYLRNRVRHELLPLLEALHPGARQSLGRATVMLRELGGLTDMALTRELELR
ncbi:MAG: tRNA lysidine(34) synthetase TilS, partial [Flavobacteriales bacterium]|nr:tRNA lysidine(34) synthetase TilS [Flavobacteriales bacterium]